MHFVWRNALALGLLATLACGAGNPLDEIDDLHASGRFAETIPPLRKLLDEDPAQARANLLLGRALFQNGSAGLAVWPLRKASESPEHAVEAGLLLTEAMLESRTAPDAVEEIDRVLALEPDNVRAHELSVEANQNAGNIEESLAAIERTLELDPENLAVAVPRVTALIGLDRIDEAGEALALARKRFEETDTEISANMLARLCIAGGMFAFEQGERESAEEQYAECIERFPTERLAVLESIRFYDRIGQGERATEILEQAMAESEGNQFRNQLARRYGAMGKREDEERLLREEAEDRPTPMSWFVLADYYVTREEYSQALDAFERAIAAGPATPRLRFAYADTLVQAERFADARRVALRIPQAELRNLILARVLLGEGKPRAALAAFESGIRLWPNNAAARFLAGQAAERVGDFPRATSHYRESFRTSPRDSEAGKALAELYSENGEHEGALQIAGRYARSHGRDPDAYLLSIRLAHLAGEHPVVTEGLMRLSQMPGQAPVAVAEELSLLASMQRGEIALEVVERSGLDLTDPVNSIALRALVEQLAEHPRALKFAERAVAARPEEAGFRELHGRALRAAGKTEESRAAFEKTLELEPENAGALAGLASLAADAGESDQAIGLYDRATAADPDDPDAALAAIAILRSSDPDAAVSRLEELLKTHPRQPNAANELAVLLVDRGKLDRATHYAAWAAWFRLPEAETTLARIEKLRGEAPASPEPAPGK